METFLHAVASVTIILLLTATGYFCAVKGWMTVQVKTFISRYLMTVGIPVMLVEDCLINRRDLPMEGFWRGSLQDVLDWAKNLPSHERNS